MKARKILVSLAALALVAAISIGGTLAYLTSKAEITNTFTVGNVGIKLTEAQTNTDGEKVKNQENKEIRREQGNAYKLMPNHTYAKDPVVTVNSNSEKCYVFVKVVNGLAGLEDTTSTIAAQMTANGWVAVTGVANVYVYTESGKAAVVEAGRDLPVFQQFKIASDVIDTKLATAQDIVITAYAIQADGFDGKTAEQIWADSGFGA